MYNVHSTAPRACMGESVLSNILYVTSDPSKPVHAVKLSNQLLNPFLVTNFRLKVETMHSLCMHRCHHHKSSPIKVLRAGNDCTLTGKQVL